MMENDLVVVLIIENIESNDNMVGDVEMLGNKD